MDCKVETPTLLHQIHANKDAASPQISTRLDTPPFSPTATIRSTGQSLSPVVEEGSNIPKVIQTSPTEESVLEPPLTPDCDGSCPDPLETIDFSYPRDSEAFSQLQKSMQKSLEISDAEPIKSSLNSDPSQQIVGKESEKLKNVVSQTTVRIEHSGLKFNAVLSELLELVPLDSIFKSLHSMRCQSSSFTTPEGSHDVEKSVAGVLDASNASQIDVNNSDCKEEPGHDQGSLNVGDEGQERNLKWICKEKSILPADDDQQQPPNSPAFDKVMKELLDVVPLDSKFYFSRGGQNNRNYKNGSGDSCCLILPTGCNAFKFISI